MGQKVHPTGIRLGIVKEHTSVWYADKRTYADYLFADLKVREYLQDKLKSASVSRIDIHRPAQTARITIHTARPGIVIGKKGEDVEKLRQDLTKQMGVPVHINICLLYTSRCVEETGEWLGAGVFPYRPA